MLYVVAVFGVLGKHRAAGGEALQAY